MNQQELSEFSKVQTAARNLADALALNDSAKLDKAKELNFATAYNIIYQIAMRPIPSNSSQANLYGTGEELYLKFQQLLAELVRRNPINPNLPTESLFHAVIGKWNQFQILEKWMLKAFQYISRFYVPHLSKPPLSFLSLVIFNQEVFKKHEKTVNNVLLDDIQRLRAGENVDQNRMKDAVKLLLKMGFGDRMSGEFVQELLRSTAKYYKEESKKCITSTSVVDYTRKVHGWLTFEQQLASWVLPDSIIQLQFLGEIERETIAEHLSFILDSPEGGFISLLRQNRTSDLKFLLQVMTRPQANGVSRMSALLKKECLEEGTRIVTKYSIEGAASGSPALQDPNLVHEVDAKSYVTEFVALHEKYLELTTTCLNHSTFSVAVKEAFEETVNLPVKISQNGLTVTSSELIARYSDLIMRGGPQNHLDDLELDQTLTKLVSLFTRISDKDEFFDCVRTSLSKRLLSNVSSDDRERTFLSKFRAKVGTTATNKLEGMLHDIDGSKDIADSYRDAKERREASFANENERNMDFSLLLLTQVFWPTMNDETLIVPRPIDSHIKAFTAHYCSGRHHRQLKWVFQYGNAVINCNVPKAQSCELLVNLYQAAVIYAFNDQDQHSVDDLLHITGLSLEEVSRHVHSFATPKVGGGLLQIFVGNGTTSEQQQGIKIPLEPGQIIKLNTLTFSPTSRKVRVPALVPKNQNQQLPGGGMLGGDASRTISYGQQQDGGMSTAANTMSSNMMSAGGGGVTSSGVDQASAGPKTEHQQKMEMQRAPTVQATIMKVMKSRQKMEHQVLIATVMDHLVQRFKPDPKFVKQCIETLLSREYIQRDANDPNMYVFLTS